MAEYGIRLSKRPGDTWVNINCPLHKDSRPSFGYNFQYDMFKCFRCGEGRSGLFLKLKNNLSNEELRKFVEKIASKNDLEQTVEPNDPKIEEMLFTISKYFRELQKNIDNYTQQEELRKLMWYMDMYIVNKAPKNKITVDGLERRFLKIQELVQNEISNSW